MSNKVWHIGTRLPHKVFLSSLYHCRPMYAYTGMSDEESIMNAWVASTLKDSIEPLLKVHCYSYTKLPLLSVVVIERSAMIIAAYLSLQCLIFLSCFDPRSSNSNTRLTWPFGATCTTTRGPAQSTMTIAKKEPLHTLSLAWQEEHCPTLGVSAA